ncbi:MAG: hypothetical protein ABIO70_14645 [Pseudomonadota bacterium]
MSEVIPWNEVEEVHRTVAGIAVRDGRVWSLLCNQQKGGKYPDKIEGNRLSYHVGRYTQRHGKDALQSLVNQPHDVRVFEKLESNRWVDRGLWRLEGVGEQTSDGYLPFYFRSV